MNRKKSKKQTLKSYLFEFLVIKVLIISIIGPYLDWLSPSNK